MSHNVPSKLTTQFTTVWLGFWFWSALVFVAFFFKEYGDCKMETNGMNIGRSNTQRDQSLFKSEGRRGRGGENGGLDFF